MPYNDELLFERDFINYLQQSCGWQDGLIKNPTEEDLIKNWANILFDNNNDVDHLNGCRLTDGEMRQIISQIEALKSPYKLNTFINGKSVTIIRENPEDTAHFNKPVSLKIYDRMEIAAGSSRYQIAEQPRFKTTNNVYPDRRGDLMLLINGMPVYHIELKKTGVSITQAEVQIEKYMVNNAFRGIFSLVQVFVAMNPEEAVYFANPGPEGKFNPLYYFHWTNSDNELINEWHDFAHSFLMIPRAHEMIGFYTVPDASDGILKVLRPYQVYAALNVSNIVSQAHWTKAEQKGGYIWHTTGSGKTLTSFKTAQLIANMSKKADKVVFLIDRVELGEQSYTDYVNFANVDDSIKDTNDTDALIRLLTSNESDEKVIITSIQKMSRIKEGEVPQSVIDKIRDKRIVFIVDECHRDQNGDMHQNIEHTFPTAMFFGYTGTPDHEVTKDIFGSERHRYTIAHGIRDKNVLGFDPYEIHIFDDNDLRKEVGLSLVHAATEDEAMADPKKRDKYLYYLNRGETPCPMTEIEKNIPVSQYQEERYRRSVVEDILKNWSVRSYGSLFHAIFATSSIPEAIEYYKIFCEERDKGTHSLKITALFDPSDDNGNNSILKMKGITQILTDYSDMFGPSYTHANYDKFKKDLCKRLAHKEPYTKIDKDKQLNIVIVVDQLLTGFDSKWINTVYLDKMQRGKNFIQTASRTNRLYGPEKRHGTIVWYRYPHTMTANFEAAVNEYSGNRPYGVFVDKLEKNLQSINLIFDDICEHFAVVGIKNFERNDDDISWRKKFAKLFSAFNGKLDSAKIQGFFWGESEYVFEHEDGPQTTVTVKIDKETYLTLVQRYKELFTRGPVGYDPPYDVDPHITEKKIDEVDNDYMNSRFKQFVRDLNKGNQAARKKNLDELHKSFAFLSQEDQTFARQFLIDVENGLAVEENKNLSDYIAEYKAKTYNDKISSIALGMGLNVDKLRELINIHPTESKINEFNRYDELFADLDIDKARVYLEKTLNRTLTKSREVKMEADSFLRGLILSGV